MKNKIAISLLTVSFLLFSNSSIISEKPNFSTEIVDNDSISTVKLIFAGDIMGHDGQINAARINDSTWDYHACFQFIKPYIESADVAIANFEVTLAGQPYKGYPQFSSPDELLVQTKNAGFDLLLLANNHCLDGGKHGLERTIKMMDSVQIMHIGTYVNQQVKDLTYPVFVTKNGIKLAFLNYTYGTNEIPPTPPNVVNFIDTVLIKNDLQKAVASHPDYIIATIHWGIEYERMYSKKQKQISDFLFENGANLVVGSHPHVIQPVDLDCFTEDSIAQCITVYSLGNFISNQRTPFRDGGFLFETTLQKKENQTTIKDYSFLPYWVYRGDYNGRYNFHVVPAAHALQNVDFYQIKSSDSVNMSDFYHDAVQSLHNIPENQFYQRHQTTIK